MQARLNSLMSRVSHIYIYTYEDDTVSSLSCLTIRISGSVTTLHSSVVREMDHITTS